MNENPDIKEALAALDEILRTSGLSMLPVKSLESIEGAVIAARTCLQSVAQEREDWAAIDAWNTAHPGTFELRIQNGGPPIVWLPQSVEWVHGATRAESLSKAATLCRAEMAK